MAIAPDAGTDFATALDGKTAVGGNNTPDATPTTTAVSWGLTDALLNDPIYGAELRNVFDLLNKKDYAGARKAFENTSFFKNNSSTVANRLKTKASQPGVYADELAKYKLQQKRRLTAAGVKLDDVTLEGILSKAYDSGLDDNQVDSLILSSGKMASMGGAQLGQVDRLKAYADSFGMEYGETIWDKYKQDLFAGTTTTEDIQAKIRKDSASAFPVFADAIDKGTSLDALASAYKSSMASILEIDADSIKWSDPKLRQALQFTDSTGKPAIKPIWQFEQDLRNDPRWEYTDNARNTLDSMSLKVLRDWGLA